VVIEQIEGGARAKPYNDFVVRHNLPWLVWRGKNQGWVERNANKSLKNTVIKRRVAS